MDIKIEGNATKPLTESINLIKTGMFKGCIFDKCGKLEYGIERRDKWYLFIHDTSCGKRRWKELNEENLVEDIMKIMFNEFERYIMFMSTKQRNYTNEHNKD